MGDICTPREVQAESVIESRTILDEDLLGVNWSIIQGKVEEESVDIIGTYSYIINSILTVSYTLL